MMAGLQTETGERKNNFPLYGIIGLLIIGVGELFLFFRFWLVPFFITPIAWSGYILAVDALNYKVRGESLIRNRSKEFFLMLPWSVVCWLVFELYNLHMRNWIYVGLPQNLVVRSLGYVWSFATIFPAILETSDLLQVVFQKVRIKPRKISRATLFIHMVFGLLCLTVPMLFPHSTAKYLIPFVWIGFALFLEPINYFLGGRSLFRYFENGELKQLFSLMLSGLVCGGLWEFWNYWAEARWVYDVPFSWSGPKVFEMPLAGFLGFIPFAVECHAMQNYLLAVLNRRKTLTPSFSS